MPETKLDKNDLYMLPQISMPVNNINESSLLIYYHKHGNLR